MMPITHVFILVMMVSFGGSPGLQSKPYTGTRIELSMPQCVKDGDAFMQDVKKMEPDTIGYRCMQFAVGAASQHVEDAVI